MTTMKQFANDSDETENLSDDEILEKPITPTEIHENVSKLRQRKQAAWILFLVDIFCFPH